MPALASTASPVKSIGSLWQSIADHAFIDEATLIEDLLPLARQTRAEKQQTDIMARRLVNAARVGRREFGGVDAFMHEYGLSSEEGVTLMCLSEALLRIPDADTADKLIADKIGGQEWEKHLGKSESLFVNASTWGLMLTGKVVEMGEEKSDGWMSRLGRIVSHTGEPVIRQALRHSIRIMGRQFILGRTIEEALKHGEDDAKKGYNFSFDMLGEAAATAEDAEKYFQSYLNALNVVAKKGKSKNQDDLYKRNSISIKLSALHPRYERSKLERLNEELLPKLVQLIEVARSNDIALTIDAEEMDRLELSLQLFENLLNHSSTKNWNGLGLAVQAYSRRAMPVFEWLADLARKTGHKIPIRLVKGAYWDTEIKRAQEAGYNTFPVFTRKPNTDVSYLACARFMLQNRDVFYPQFATHNAHTLSAILAMTEDVKGYEFQRLHGMGAAIYEDLVPADKMNLPCRIYAPVGAHTDLLAYLVRRLLENGANTSFVNRLADDDAPIRDIIANPVETIEKLEQVPSQSIRQPAMLFGESRKNSSGHPIWQDAVRLPLLEQAKQVSRDQTHAGPIVGGETLSGNQQPIVSPHDHSQQVGTITEASKEDIELALSKTEKAQQKWNKLGGERRAEILENAADLYESNSAKLIGLLISEAGKTLDNAIADLREAVDFLRYYAVEARLKFSNDQILPGPTGETNAYQLHGRGTFACISPWNFPLAIFTGQLSAALAAGNCVVAKPAEQTPLIGYVAIKLLLEAGVPGDVLHYMPGRGETVGAGLVNDPRINGVAFTGSNDTASLINRSLAARSGQIVPLIAETGGMNAMIVDSTALPEQTTRDVIRSSFDSAGQRCSALRVLFVQEDIADGLIKMLTGAMEELKVGDPFDYSTDIGPVIDEEARLSLESHKSKMAKNAKTLLNCELPNTADKGTFVSPAIYEIENINQLEREVFGPIVHVVRYSASNLQKVCNSINATGYGLTLGIQTRTDSTVEEIIANVRVGNIYVNRNQIGAIVGSQPFGGEGLSGTGPKAGGPNYLPRFAIERVVSTDITASGGNAALLALEE